MTGRGFVPPPRERLLFEQGAEGRCGVSLTPLDVPVVDPSAAFGEYARSRGWRHARIVSAGESDLKRQLGFETDEGAQLPGLSVFERDASGVLSHFYSQSAMLGADGFRGMDLLNPLWHFIDALPAGRADFMPRKSYET